MRFATILLLLLLPLGLACSRGEGSEDGSGEESTRSARAGDDESENSGDEDAEEAVPVEVVELARGRIESVLKFSTNLEAENEVQVFSEASRKVRQLLVEEGSEVRRGQVLIRLEDDEQRTALARAESQLKKAQREYERQSRLYDQQLISEEIYTEATYNLEQLELALEDAKRQLSYTEVRAPISGTVTERLVNVGDHVTQNQHLFDIVDFDSIVARVYVPEKELYRIRKDLEARIFAEAAGSEPRTGTVDRVAPRVDPRSGTVKVTVAIPRNQALLPGMYVSVELITNVHEDALLVPKKALVYDADQIFIFRPTTEMGEDGTEEHRVERLLILPVLEDRDNIEPAGVLAAGDRVVVAGQAGLKDGSLVRFVGGDEPEPAEAGGETIGG
jgi:membrane fusion protein (multidrug efflux system)